MNVLVVSSKFPPEYAGSGLRAHTTYRRLARDYDIRYEVLTSSVKWNTSCVYTHEGARVTRIARKLGRFHPGDQGEDACPGLVRRIGNIVSSRIDYCSEAPATWAYLRKNGKQFDVFHVFGNNNVTSAVLTYAKVTGKPCLIELVNYTENPHQYEPWLLSRLLGRGFPRRMQIVCISPYLATLCRRFGYDEDRLWCRPNQVDERRFFFTPKSAALRDAAWPGLAPEDVLLVYLARFRVRKNQRFLVDVLRLLPPHYKLLLAGPLADAGPLAARQNAYYHAILEAVAHHGLEDRIALRPGFVAAPETLLRAADVFLMPSVHEALGTTFLEALACGTPCVTNVIPGVFDRWIREGENGFIRPLDPTAWADAVTRAAAIPGAAMARESAAILAETATTVIDGQYVARLAALAGQAWP
jgi:glycosyltransferase involved in cell wall biosynthesis